MRTFAPEPQATITHRSGSHLREGHQADLRTDFKGDSVTTEPPGFSYDFSRIPLHPAAGANIESELRFTTANHALEQEADSISQQFTGISEPGVQREQPQNHVQTERTAPPIVHQVTGSPGQPLDGKIRGFMESRLGHDFSQVRIHTDAVAASSARAIHANAYTLGRHIVFGSGQYSPQSDRGQRLLAHELVHVAQQRAQAAPMVARQPEQKPPPESPKTTQQKPAQQGLCSKLDLSKLQLPRKNNAGAEFFETTANGIRFLAGVSAKQAGAVRGKINDVASQITRLNALVTDAANKVTLVIVTDGGSEFRSLCGQPVLLIDPQEFTQEAAAHETMHGVTYVLQQQSQATGPQAAGAKNFLDQVADIYLQLNSLTIEVSPGVTVAATNLVDPKTLNPKEKAEHPQDNMDEFLSSAVAVFLVSRKALEKKIQEFGKKDPKLKAAADQLMKLLDDFVGKQTLPAAAAKTTSAGKDIEAEKKRIKATPEVDDAVFVTHGQLHELLLPPGKTP